MNMLFMLGSQKLLLRDIENFEKDNYADNKTTNSLSSSFKGLAKSFFKFVVALGKIIVVNNQLHQALNKLNRAIKNDYVQFSKANHREKEDILIKWERLGTSLNSHTPPKNQDTSFFTKGTANKSNEIIANVNTFIDSLKSELYPNINKPLSQEYLKELAGKFNHLPQDVLNDMTSDEYLEFTH